MKKPILIVLTILLSHITYAQTLVDKKDEFTGKQTKSAIVYFGRKVFGAPILGLSTIALIFSETNNKISMYFFWPGFNSQLNP
jgi:hypothetical protein